MQLPQIGRHVKAGESIGEIESVKAVSDLYAPVSGEIVEVNASLPDNLEILGSDPFGAGWVLKIRMSNPEELDVLLDQTAYDILVSGQGH
jgi:glycine cleavage system H protein